jgi:hypothetical protein
MYLSCSAFTKRVGVHVLLLLEENECLVILPEKQDLIIIVSVAKLLDFFYFFLLHRCSYLILVIHKELAPQCEEQLPIILVKSEDGLFSDEKARILKFFGAIDKMTSLVVATFESPNVKASTESKLELLDAVNLKANVHCSIHAEENVIYIL